VVALLLLIWVCASGALFAQRLDEAPRRPADTFALGAAIGLAVFAFFGFILGWMFGLSALTVTLAALLTTATGLRLGVLPSARLIAPAKRPRFGVLLLALLAIATAARLADRTLIENENGIATGARHNFGDLPFHMGIAAGFAWGENFPPDHPELAGVSLTYPFFGDLIAGMILAIGGTWRDAFFWPALILGLSVPVALVRFGEAVTGSRALGRVGAALTFFSGGLGFKNLTDAAAFSTFWTDGPDLTINDAGTRYANFITTLFIPQRAILFGWPILFFALALLVEALGKDGSKDGGSSRARLFRQAGILASVLPLVHAHSFAVLVFCALVFTARAGLKPALAFAQGVAPLATPAILFMLAHSSLSTGRFFAWAPGFDGGAAEPLRYWLMNAGLFLPLVLVGLVNAPSFAARFKAAPFIALFLGANLFRLSPWMWDNMKFLAPAHAGLAPFAAIALALIWKHGRAGKASAVLAFLVATLSGALDVSKVALSGAEYAIFDRAGLAFAERIRQATPPQTTILTASTHNHPVLLSGRREFLGYEGHLWSQGLDSTGRKEILESMFRGAAQPAQSAAQVRIDAIAVTPAEGSLIADPSALEGLPSLVDSPYRLLKVR
jgi:hypothetical protein